MTNKDRQHLGRLAALGCVEEWRLVPGYGGNYEASSFGRVRSKERVLTKRHKSGCVMTQVYPEKMLKPQDRKGYGHVRIGVDRKKFSVGIHRMVLAAFVREPMPGEICRHLDGNPKNNVPSNLAWGTHEENMADRMAHGNYKSRSEHVMAKLSEEQVRLILESDMTGVALSKMLGVGTTQISRIRRGTSWRKSA